MIEIINIFFFSLVFSLLIFYPVLGNFKSNLWGTTLSANDFKVLNLFLFCNFLIFLSIFEIKLSSIIKIILLTYILFIFFILYKKNFFYLKLSNYKYYFFVYFVIFIISIDLALSLNLYWDAKKLWLPKALVFYNDLTISDLKNTAYQHYSYFGSLIWAFFWKVSNMSQEYFGRIFYIVIFILSLFIYSKLFSPTPKKQIVILLFLVLIIYDYWHLRGTQEILNFSFLLICSVYLYEMIFNKKNNNFNLFIIILGINILIWTKNEGTIIGLLILANIIFFLNRNINTKLVLIFAFCLLVVLRFQVYKYFGVETSLSKDFDFKNIIEILFNNFSFENIRIVLKYLIISFLKFPHILLSLIFAVLIMFDKNLFKKSLFLYFYLITSILVFVTIYLASPNNIEFMLSTGFFRIIFEISAPYMLFVLVFLKKKLVKELN